MSLNNAIRSVVLFVDVAQASGLFLIPQESIVISSINKYCLSFDGSLAFQEATFARYATPVEKSALNAAFSAFVANEEDIKALAARCGINYRVRKA